MFRLAIDLNCVKEVNLIFFASLVAEDTIKLLRIPAIVIGLSCSDSVFRGNRPNRMTWMPYDLQNLWLGDHILSHVSMGQCMMTIHDDGPMDRCMTIALTGTGQDGPLMPWGISMRKIEKDVRFWGMCDDRLKCAACLGHRHLQDSKNIQKYPKIPKGMRAADFWTMLNYWTLGLHNSSEHCGLLW